MCLWWGCRCICASCARSLPLRVFGVCTWSQCIDDSIKNDVDVQVFVARLCWVVPVSVSAVCGCICSVVLVVCLVCVCVHVCACSYYTSYCIVTMYM